MGNPKNCTVSFQDSDGVRHSVDVGAATLYEAAVLALKAFREVNCGPGPASQLSVDVRNPSVTHTLSAQSVENWLNGGGDQPALSH